MKTNDTQKRTYASPRCKTISLETEGYLATSGSTDDLIIEEDPLFPKMNSLNF